MRMPELVEEGDNVIDVLVPGFIEAHSGRQFGEPCIAGTRIPTSVGQGWVWDSLGRPEDEHLTREQIIACAAFDAGVRWQRSRARRQRMERMVGLLWQNIRDRERNLTELDDPR